MSSSNDDRRLSAIRRRWTAEAILALGLGVLTSLPVWVGVMFGIDYLPRRSHPWQNEPGYLNTLCAWDGVWYANIVRHGYRYDPMSPSSVAFFPAYPLLAAGVARLTGFRAEAALLLVTYISLGCCFVLAARYTTERWPREPLAMPFVLLAMGLWPMGLFLRMGYTESLFLLLILIVLLGVRRQGPMWALALCAGAASGTRAVGVAACLPVIVEWWRRSTSFVRFILGMPLLVLLCCWGLLAYIVYLHLHFGEPLAFAKTQQHWAMRESLPLGQHVAALLTLEPIRAVVDPSSPSYWARHEYVRNPVFSLQLWNCIYFAVCVAVVGWGWWAGWLDAGEGLLALGLLAIPYWFQAHRMMMLGHGRFTSVVFPMHLVLGRGLARWPPPLSALVCGFATMLLAFDSALFAAWHRVF